MPSNGSTDSCLVCWVTSSQLVSCSGLTTSSYTPHPSQSIRRPGHGSSVYARITTFVSVPRRHTCTRPPLDSVAVFDGTGFHFDPSCMGALRDMEGPNTAEHLQQLVHAMNWMRTSVSHYAHHVKPLLEVLERAYI